MTPLTNTTTAAAIATSRLRLTAWRPSPAPETDHAEQTAQHEREGDPESPALSSTAHAWMTSDHSFVW